MLTVADPLAVSRAWALELLIGSFDLRPPDPPAAPAWVRRFVPPLGRLWGDGVTKVHRLVVNEPILEWAKTDPDGLRRAARGLASWRPPAVDPRRKPEENEAAAWAALAERPEDEQRLMSLIASGGLPAVNRQVAFPQRFRILMASRPGALAEAAEIVIAHPEATRAAMTRFPYTEPETIGGYLDRDLPPYPAGAGSTASASASADLGASPTYPKTTQRATPSARAATAAPSQ